VLIKQIIQSACNKNNFMHKYIGIMEKGGGGQGGILQFEKEARVNL